MSNPYLPKPVKIEEIITETEDGTLKTFKLSFLNPEDEQAFRYTPGQFAELSIAGKGEIPIGIASSPTEKGYLLFTVNKVGVVTTHLHNMSAGEVMGVRGPLGRPYPIDKLEYKNVVISAGGFAFTTLRSTIVYMLDASNRNRFGNITVIYGARIPDLLLYKEQLKEWEGRDDIKIILTVDKEAEGWHRRVGFVPSVTKEVSPSADNARVLVCGPPAMIKFTKPVLIELGFTPENIIMSLERRMKCGIGICGRCNIGPKYVCKDGPVFTLAELNELPKEE